MSEEALAKHIDDRMAQGEFAAAPSDPETRTLAGVVRLTQSALGTPDAPEHAERASRERVISQMSGDGPTSRALRDETPPRLGIWKALMRRLRDGPGR